MVLDLVDQPTNQHCRMAGKKKLGQILIKLVSQAGTGYFYVTKKNPRNVPYKLQRVKYDPVVNRRVLFSEAKMK